jgi:hypothetical protein
VPEIAMEDSQKLPKDLTRQLRKLAHDLSNWLETILQAACPMGRSKLDPDSKKWTQLIDTAANDATTPESRDQGNPEDAGLVSDGGQAWGFRSQDLDT